MAKRSCQEAMRELSNVSPWLYYDTTYLFTTAPTLSTGTVAYDNADGTYDNLLTLSGATFPENARLYTVILNGAHYPIDRYIDTTNVMLDQDQNPGADIAAGASYTLYRPSYPVPIDFVEIGRLFDMTNQREIDLISSDQHHADTVYYHSTPDTPLRATIRNSGEYLNSLSLLFSPPAGSALRYEYVYQRRPKSLVVEKYSTGTLTVTEGETTVEIASGSVGTEHIGSVVRFGTASSEPTSVLGGLDDTIIAPSHQAIILSVSSNGTSFEIDEAPESTMTYVKFTISDPLDVDHGAMLSAAQRLAEAAYTRMTKRDPRERREREELAMWALRNARERDSRVRNLGPRFPCDPWDGDITDDE